MDLSEQSSTVETQSFQLYNLSLTRKFHIESDEELDFFGHHGLFVMYFPISQIGSKLLHKGCLSCTTVNVSSQKHCMCILSCWSITNNKAAVDSVGILL